MWKIDLCQQWQERYHVSSQVEQTAPIPPPPRCFLVNIAYFLTWTTEWRGQPGGDPHLQLWLLPQQSPDITNHTPAGGETESVWQLLVKGAGEEKMGEDKTQTDKQQKKRGGRETTISVWGRWEEHNEQFCMLRGFGAYLFSFSQNHLEKHHSKSAG